MHIREYSDDTDRPGLHRCVAALQDFERVLVPSMPQGCDMCEAYVAEMLSKCARYAGKILVLDSGSDIGGFVSIYSSMISEEIDDGPDEFAYIGDLVVLENFRALGYGFKLLRDAEAVAIAAGAKKIRIGVLADNTKALNLYQSHAYKPFAVQLEKDL